MLRHVFHPIAYWCICMVRWTSSCRIHSAPRGMPKLMTLGISNRTLSGLALRQCIELGLHRKIPWLRVESDVLKVQMRRRVFWCSYNLDRAVAVTLGRPVGIADSDITVEVILSDPQEKWCIY